MAIKEKDFVELEYTGKLKDDNSVLDTTDEKTAKDSAIYQKGQRFGKVIICIGEGYILKGLEKELVGKEPGKEYTISLPTESAFGKKSAQMVQLIATNKFVKEGINPQVGLQINVDGMFGVIRTVTGGRTLVDFNHPLAGKDVVYTVKVSRIVTDANEKVKGLLELQFGKEMAKSEIKDGNLEVKLQFDMPLEYTQKLADQFKTLIPEIKNVSFVKEAKEVKVNKEGKAKEEKV